MNLPGISASLPIAPAARAVVAEAPAEIAPRREAAAPAGHDPRLLAGEAAAAAVLAAQAIHDCRQTGPSESVRRFDRMENVIAGFEHLRDVLEGITAAAAEDFGPANLGKTADAPAAASLDLRV